MGNKAKINSLILPDQQGLRVSTKVKSKTWINWPLGKKLYMIETSIRVKNGWKCAN